MGRYQLSQDFWHILVYRMLFVLVFVCTVSFILWLLNCIPATPQDLRDRMTEEIDLTREIEENRRLDASATDEAPSTMDKACQTDFEVGWLNWITLKLICLSISSAFSRSPWSPPNQTKLIGDAPQRCRSFFFFPNQRENLRSHRKIDDKMGKFFNLSSPIFFKILI